MVLDGVVGPPGHHLGDLCPLVAELLVLDEDRVVLRNGIPVEIGAVRRGNTILPNRTNKIETDNLARGREAT